jgi:hypothetical protein
VQCAFGYGEWSQVVVGLLDDKGSVGWEWGASGQ